jgi:hypothetical protein
MGKTEASRSDAATAEAVPVLVAVGRGKTGKTTKIRWIADVAITRGVMPLIGDADRTNPTLAAYFPDLVQRPPGASDDEIGHWFGSMVKQALRERRPLLVDFGGGDRVLKSLSAEIDLPGFLGAKGHGLVVLHSIGADADDLSYLDETERDGLLTPERTAVVFNAGVIPAGRSIQAVLKEHEKNEVLHRAFRRGVKFIVMPALKVMPLLDAGRIRFTEAAPPRIDEWEQQYVIGWLRKMQDAFAPIAEWLP